MTLDIFSSTSCPFTSYKVSSQSAFRFRISRAKQIVKMAAMGAILEFRLELFKLFFYLQVDLSTKFESTGISVQEKKHVKKKKNHDGSHGGYLGFQTGMILANFDLQVAPILPPKFQVN